MASREAIQVMEGIYGRVDQRVREMIGLLPGMSIAAQSDGDVISNQHRIVNFLGSGVSVVDDPSSRRVNVFIPGSSLANVISHVLLSSTAAKTLDLWNGSSNNAPPSNWETTGFSDAGWTTAVVPTGGTATTISGASRLWPSGSPSNSTQRALFRETFTVPAGTITTASMVVEADDHIIGVYINGTFMGSANGNPGVQVARLTLAVDPTLLVTGSNLLALEVANAANTIAGAAWGAYSVDIVQPGAVQLTASSEITSDVAMTNANQFYDGPSITLSAGTWLVIAGATLNHTTNTGFFTAKLWDGTTVSASGEITQPTTNHVYPIVVSGIVAPSVSTTYKISVACNAAGATMKASTVHNSTAKATWIRAVKIG